MSLGWSSLLTASNPPNVFFFQDKQPSCEYMGDATADTLNVTCSVCFTGQLDPHMSCFNNSSHVEMNASHLVGQAASQDHCRFYRQNYDSIMHLRGSTLTCSVIFESQKHQVLYNFTWTWPPVNFTCV